MKNPSVLIFSVALNGYHWCYRKTLQSHGRYAAKYGYQHCVVKKPLYTALGSECCWLKLTLMRRALVTGYDVVVFIDADAHVNDIAPRVESVFKDNKTFYMAKGYTGRFNSGVLIARNNQNVIDWLKVIINSRLTAVSEHSRVGWGENGHVIDFARGRDFIETLPLCWNNTYSATMRDYIRHYSHGPLRRAVALRLYHKVLSRLTKAIEKYLRPKCLVRQAQDPLAQLTQAVTEHYTHFKMTRSFSD